MELLYSVVHNYGDIVISAINAYTESNQVVPMEWYQAREWFLEDRFVLEKVMENTYVPGKHQNVFDQYKPCSRPATFIRQITHATWAMMETDAKTDPDLNGISLINKDHTIRMLKMLKLVGTHGFRKNVPMEELVNHAREEIPRIRDDMPFEEYFKMFTDTRSGRFLANSLVGLYAVRMGYMTREEALAAVKGL